MEKDTIRNFLTRSGFSDVQAGALSDILAEQATKADIRELRGDFRRLEQRVESRLDAFEQKVESRMDAFEQKIDARVAALEQKMDDRFASAHKDWEKSLRDLEARLTWRFIALATFMGVIIGLVGQFLG